MNVYSHKSLLFAAALIVSYPSHGTEHRWYAPDQVSQGQQLFKSKCAKCHGVNAEGEPDWRELDEEGKYPPPPLDGNAYAWLHTLAELRQQILHGSRIKQGEMPSFKNKLDARQIDSVIAFFQSKWDDDTYRVWQTRQVSIAARWKQQVQQQEPLHHQSSHWLKRHLSSAQIEPGAPMKTPVKGILESRVNGSYMYLSEDGRYAFTGDMIDLLDGSNVTELSQARDTRRLIQTYAEEYMLVYPAQGREKTHLTIFTDTSCVYCRKMHREIPDLLAKGVSVRIIPYPRRGLGGKGYVELSSIWCSEDPHMALLEYVKGSVLPEQTASCDNTRAVDAGFLLGNSVGVSGTPLLVLENGERMKGYNPASEVLEQMGIR